MSTHNKKELAVKGDSTAVEAVAFPEALAQSGARTRLALQSAVVTAAMTSANLIIAGHEMAAAKKALGETRGRKAEGEGPRLTWEQWVKTYTVRADGEPASLSWADHLVAVAKRYKSAMEARGDSDILKLMDRSPSSLNEAERATFFDEVKAFAGDRSLAQIAMELGSQGRKSGSGSGNAGSSKQVQETRPACFTDEMWAVYQTLEDGSQAKDAAFTLGALIKDVLPIASTEPALSSPHLAHLPPVFITEIFAVIDAAAKRLAGMLPKKKRTAKGAKVAKKRRAAK